MLLPQLHCLRRLLQAGACDHELGASHVDRTFDDVFKIALVRRSAMIVATEHGIGQVDTNLSSQSTPG